MHAPRTPVSAPTTEARLGCLMREVHAAMTAVTAAVRTGQAEAADAADAHLRRAREHAAAVRAGVSAQLATTPPRLDVIA